MYCLDVEHPLASVIVIMYVPGDKLLMSSVVAEKLLSPTLVHEKVYPDDARKK